MQLEKCIRKFRISKGMYPSQDREGSTKAPIPISKTMNEDDGGGGGGTASSCTQENTKQKKTGGLRPTRNYALYELSREKSI
jgi:hypothetical protein